MCFLNQKWTEQVKDFDELKELLPIMMCWQPDGWILEEVNKPEINQISLF